MTGNFKFGYLGQSEQVVESGLFKHFNKEHLNKWIIGYYNGGKIPMVGILTFSSSRMRVKIYHGTDYEINSYRLIGDNLSEIIISDIDNGA